MAEGVAARLRVHAEAVRALADRDTGEEMAIGRVEGVDLGVVTA
jgi:hypothetical protein